MRKLTVFAQTQIRTLTIDKICQLPLAELVSPKVLSTFIIFYEGGHYGRSAQNIIDFDPSQFPRVKCAEKCSDSSQRYCVSETRKMVLNRHTIWIETNIENKGLNKLSSNFEIRSFQHNIEPC